jgi:hypothetical protein
MGQEATRLDDDRTPLNATAATAGDGTTSDDPDEIEQEIEQTRAEMSDTIDAIQEKLDPEVLQEQAKDTIREAKAAAVEVVDHAITQAKQAVRGATLGKVEDMARYAEDTAGGWRDTLVETVKAHPVPAALAGLSLGYLLLNREPARPRTRTTRHGGVIEYRPQEAPTGGSAPLGRTATARGSPPSPTAPAPWPGGCRRPPARSPGRPGTPPGRRPSRCRRRRGRWPTRCRRRPTGRRAS